MRRLALLAGIGVIVAILGLVLRAGGVEVTINNRGPAPLREVVVHVTGNSYQVGDVGVGESRTVAVQSQGESHVEVEATGGDGPRSRHLVDCYFESAHYRGVITVEFENGSIKRIDNRVGTSIR